VILSARRNLSAYAALFAMIPKLFMAYHLWFWIGLVLSIISMAILVFFWRAIYADTNTISGLTLHQMLNYILLAFVFMPLTNNNLIWEMGTNLREGTIIHHLLRPVNFQGMNYAQSLGTLVTGLILQVPMVIVPGLCLAWVHDHVLLQLVACLPDVLYNRDLGLGCVDRRHELFSQRFLGAAGNDAGMATQYCA
jgi:ABC-2 type transport system permease protein